VGLSDISVDAFKSLQHLMQPGMISGRRISQSAWAATANHPWRADGEKAAAHVPFWVTVKGRLTAVQDTVWGKHTCRGLVLAVQTPAVVLQDSSIHCLAGVAAALAVDQLWADTGYAAFLSWIVAMVAWAAAYGVCKRAWVQANLVVSPSRVLLLAWHCTAVACCYKSFGLCTALVVAGRHSSSV
jgi:hypothetical protein